MIEVADSFFIGCICMLCMPCMLIHTHTHVCVHISIHKFFELQYQMRLTIIIPKIKIRYKNWSLDLNFFQNFAVLKKFITLFGICSLEIGFKKFL